MTETTLPPPRIVGVTFNPRLDAARALAYDIYSAIRARGVEAWMEDDEAPHADEFARSDLVVCLGGDGTVLRCAHLAIPSAPVILGVNFGRLGFLTEIDADQVLAHLGEVLAGGGRIEERSMVRASVAGSDHAFHGLNEVVVGRATLSRPLQLAVDVDSIRIADYRCDGVIVASATGSTAYALSVGGPVIHPESRDLVVVPVAPHLASQHAVIVPGNETIRLTLEPGQQAVLSVDGDNDLELHEGDSVVVTLSEHRARFLRLHPRTDFYLRMASQLGWHRPPGNSQPLPPVGAAASRIDQDD